MCSFVCSFLSILFPFPFVQFVSSSFSSCSVRPVRVQFVQFTSERPIGIPIGIPVCTNAGPVCVCVHLLLLLFVFMCKCQCVLCRAFGILYCALLCIWGLRARWALLVELSASSKRVSGARKAREWFKQIATTCSTGKMAPDSELGTSSGQCLAGGTPFCFFLLFVSLSLFLFLARWHSAQLATCRPSTLASWLKRH